MQIMARTQRNAIKSYSEVHTSPPGFRPSKFAPAAMSALSDYMPNVGPRIFLNCDDAGPVMVKRCVRDVNVSRSKRDTREQLTSAVFLQATPP